MRLTTITLGLLVRACIGQQQEQGLHSLFVASGKLFFGTATDTNLFSDTPYRTIANNSLEFGLVVPENSQKWQATEPTAGNFSFTNPDRVFAASKANGQIRRCHTLTWHSQLPSFVQTTNWTPSTLTAAIQSHISNVVRHFAGQCYSWDVVNEALAENGTLRSSIFSSILGPSFIPISFSAAAAADPAAKLYYNDFNLETNPLKLSGAVSIVRDLQAAGVKIDGVGFQAHLDVGSTPNLTSLTTTLQTFTDMGLEVAYTELDIAHGKLPASQAALEQQAKDYVTVVSSCLAVSKCVGIVVWEFTDKYSWIPSTFPGKGDACLYDANFTKKAAHRSVSSLLVAVAAAATAAPATGNRTGTGMTGTVGGGGEAGVTRTAGATRTAVGTVLPSGRNSTGGRGSRTGNGTVVITAPVASGTRGSNSSRVGNGTAAAQPKVTVSGAGGLLDLEDGVQWMMLSLLLALAGGLFALL